MLVNHRMQVLHQTAITSVKNTRSEKKFFEEVLQKVPFKTLVITIVFKS